MIRFDVEVAAKVETLRFDGEKQFTFQGRLAPKYDDPELSTMNEPQAFGMIVPEELWRATEVGDVLSFPLDMAASPLREPV